MDIKTFHRISVQLTLLLFMSTTAKGCVNLFTVSKNSKHSLFCGFVNRFVEYWARIGSEDNMTLCHRPTCRKEGVLLDYSTDGGALT